MSTAIKQVGGHLSIGMERLIHYSRKPLLSVHSVEQAAEPFPYTKPNGLWVSVEGPDDWPEWCRAEGFRLEMLTRQTEVVLSPDAKMLRVESPEAIDAFTVKYGRQCPPMRSIGINWARVAKRYQGIIIAPYIWERRLSLNGRRLDTDWYYPWDCASGCIWDAAAVSQLIPLPSIT